MTAKSASCARTKYASAYGQQSIKGEKCHFSPGMLCCPHADEYFVRAHDALIAIVRLLVPYFADLATS